MYSKLYKSFSQEDFIKKTFQKERRKPRKNNQPMTTNKGNNLATFLPGFSLFALLASIAIIGLFYFFRRE